MDVIVQHWIFHFIDFRPFPPNYLTILLNSDSLHDDNKMRIKFRITEK